MGLKERRWSRCGRRDRRFGREGERVASLVGIEIWCERSLVGACSRRAPNSSHKSDKIDIPALLGLALQTGQRMASRNHRVWSSM